MKRLLWLDDIRDPNGPMEDGQLWFTAFSPIKEAPYSIHWVKSYREFVDWIKFNGLPDAICFDHDLGMEVAIKAREKGMSKRESRKLKQKEMTGMDCAKWLVDYCIDNQLALPLYNIQSANPVGKDNIDGLLQNFIKHQDGNI